LKLSREVAGWLAAFASYVLHMAVVLHHGSFVLWESAGTRGSVAIHLSQYYPPAQAQLLSLAEPLSPEGGLDVAIKYPLNEAL
jgi:hypothetical protein